MKKYNLGGAIMAEVKFDKQKMIELYEKHKNNTLAYDEQIEYNEFKDTMQYMFIKMKEDISGAMSCIKRIFKAIKGFLLTVISNINSERRERKEEIHRLTMIMNKTKKSRIRNKIRKRIRDINIRNREGANI